MRLFFRKKPAPRWVDTPDFAWTPDEPLASNGNRPLRPQPAAAPPEPQIVPPARQPASEIISPAAVTPQPEILPDPPRPEPLLTIVPSLQEPAAEIITPAPARGPRLVPDAPPPEPLLKIVTPQPAEPVGEMRKAAQPEPPQPEPPQPEPPRRRRPSRPDTEAGPWGPRRNAATPEPAACEAVPPLVSLASEISPPPAPRKLPRPANSNRPDSSRPPGRPPRLAWLRLRIGLAQGFGLYVLSLTRAANVFPGNDPVLFSALWLAGLLAPLVWMEGLGSIRRPLLLTWTAVAASALFALGLYRAWRGADPVSADLGLLLPGLILILAQAGLHIACSPRPGYRAAFAVSWRLAARLLVWAIVTGIAWAVLGSSTSLVNWLRHRYPMLPPGLDISFATMTLVGLAGALGWQFTAGRRGLSRLVRKALIACTTIALPLLVLLSAGLVVRQFAFQPITLAEALTAALLLLIAINASYRWGWRRNAVRRWSEFTAAFLMLALTAIAAVALDARVAEYGWSVGRMYAGAATAVLSCYAITYGGAALIGIGGGRWMQRIEPANWLLAASLLIGAIALATPLADPARLAAHAQARRLEQGRVDPAAFDFAWLKGNGRFGQEVLSAMTHSATAEIARDAAIALLTPASAATPTPTEIGANITVRTPGARLPNTLLARDWATVAKAPPCLTKPALSCDAWFLDLDGDGKDEILLVYGNDARWWAAVMKQAGADWDLAATLSSPPCRGSLSALRAGAFVPTDPLPGWRDLWVAGMRLSPQPARPAETSCLQ